VENIAGLNWHWMSVLLRTNYVRRAPKRESPETEMSESPLDENPWWDLHLIKQAIDEDGQVTILLKACNNLIIQMKILGVPELITLCLSFLPIEVRLSIPENCDAIYTLLSPFGIDAENTRSDASFLLLSKHQMGENKLGKIPEAKVPQGKVPQGKVPRASSNPFWIKKHQLFIRVTSRIWPLKCLSNDGSACDQPENKISVIQNAELYRCIEMFSSGWTIITLATHVMKGHCYTGSLNSRSILTDSRGRRRALYKNHSVSFDLSCGAIMTADFSVIKHGQLLHKPLDYEPMCHPSLTADLSVIKDGKLLQKPLDYQPICHPSPPVSSNPMISAWQLEHNWWQDY
jgi:hypothetical protein